MSSFTAVSPLAPQVTTENCRERILRNPSLTSIQKVARPLGTSMGALVSEAEAGLRR